MGITNVLIIQFSTRYPDWEKVAFNSDESLRTEWFKFRANLFNKGLAQCLKHQTKQVSKIYIVLDKNDVALYEAHLQDDAYLPIYFDPTKLWFADQIKNDLIVNGITEDYLVSRIDSDDLIHKDYFKNITAQIENNPTRLMTACTGYRSNLSQMQGVHYDNSPFMSQFFPTVSRSNSFVETLQLRTNTAIIIYNFSHSKLHQMPHKKNVDAEWMQLIHGTNVCNNFAGSFASHDMFFSEMYPMDPVWFKEWAGFDLPSPTILHQTFKR